MDANFSGRYSDILEDAIQELNGIKILREDFQDDYQGYVDVDVLLNDGRVFSYYYSYGSCSGCDEWEANNNSEEEIKTIMKTEATYFDNLEQYQNWRKKVEENKR